jgi:hypothetical protein
MSKLSRAEQNFGRAKQYFSRRSFLHSQSCLEHCQQRRPFVLIDFYPPDSWRENDRAFVLHNRLSNLGRHRFGLLFQDQSGSGACFAVLGGCHGRNMNSWVSLLQDPDDFTAIIREHEDTLTTKAMITWKNGESRGNCCRAGSNARWL